MLFSRRVAPQDVGRRPLGVPTLEDKIVQGAVAETLSVIYEVDFLGFSYGFRPGRNPHQALSALHTAIMSQRVNWVLDADIRSFFDSVDHEWLLRMLAHRIADPRILRLVRKWLEAGILEGSEKCETTKGTPQGRESARSSQTSSCTTFSISGFTNGVVDMRAVELRSSVMLTTSSWDSRRK